MRFQMPSSNWPKNTDLNFFMGNYAFKKGSGSEPDAIQQERARAEALFQSIGDGVITTDEHGKINRINAVALELLGFQEKELLGQWYPKVVKMTDENGEEVSTITRPITRAFLTGKPVSARMNFVKKNNSQLPVSLTVSPIIFDERPIGAVEVFRDVSKEAEVDRMKSEFIALASHQLRTPLTALNLNIQLLLQHYVGKLSGKQIEVLKNAEVSVERMHEIINTLLNITRIEAGRIAVVPTEVNLRSLIEQLLIEAKLKADEKKIKLSLKSNAKLPAIKTDPILLNEAIANLISNAIKYSLPKSKVTISLTHKGDDIICGVKDQGYGIPKADQSSVFMKFFRGSNVKEKESVGTGLGLYMVKGVIDNLEGKIWFESHENKGTTFFLSVPIQGPIKKEGSTTVDHVPM